MYSLLLRKALPFALTFILGSLVGGLFKAVGVGDGGASNARSYFYGYDDGHGHSCRMRARRRYLVAESKPLNILYTPDATWSVPRDSLRRGTDVHVMAVVIFGADGKVQGVESANLISACGKYKGDEVDGESLEAVKRAAAQIRFEPETVDGVPVTVVRETNIRVALN